MGLNEFPMGQQKSQQKVVFLALIPSLIPPNGCQMFNHTESQRKPTPEGWTLAAVRCLKNSGVTYGSGASWKALEKSLSCVIYDA